MVDEAERLNSQSRLLAAVVFCGSSWVNIEHKSDVHALYETLRTYATISR